MLFSTQAAGIDNVMIIRSIIEQEVTNFRVHVFCLGSCTHFEGVSFISAMINFNSADCVVRRHVLKPSQTFSSASALLPRPLPPSSLSLSLSSPQVPLSSTNLSRLAGIFIRLSSLGLFFLLLSVSRSSVPL